MKEMSDQETAVHLRKWVESKHHSQFAWPTDGCGYYQHINFVRHRNQHWHGEDPKEFDQFILDYARLLMKEYNGG